jgi:hypothetical protein
MRLPYLPTCFQCSPFFAFRSVLRQTLNLRASSPIVSFEARMNFTIRSLSFACGCSEPREYLPSRILLAQSLVQAFLMAFRKGPSWLLLKGRANLVPHQSLRRAKSSEPWVCSVHYDSQFR